MTLEELRRLSEAATPGPWGEDGADVLGREAEPVWATDHVVCHGHDYDDYGGTGDADRAFIVAAVNYVRELLEAKP